LRVNTHVTASLLSRLPVPVLRRDHPRFPRLLSLSRVLLDASTPIDQLPEYVEMQAAVACLYGLNEEEFSRVLETFPLIDRTLRASALEIFKRRTAATVRDAR
jgi:hypothetical protein